MINCVLFLYIKGFDYLSIGLYFVLNMIKEVLGIFDISVFMGVNFVKEVVREMFGEAIIGKIVK